jgi:hypothetical protein
MYVLLPCGAVLRTVIQDESKAGAMLVNYSDALHAMDC